MVILGGLNGPTKERRIAACSLTHLSPRHPELASGGGNNILMRRALTCRRRFGVSPLSHKNLFATARTYLRHQLHVRSALERLTAALYLKPYSMRICLARWSAGRRCRRYMGHS